MGSKERASPDKVYAIQSGEWVKIGISSNPKSRVGSIRTSSPFGAELLVSQEQANSTQARQREKELHERFEQYRTKHESEWFELPESKLEQLIYDLTDSDNEESDTASREDLVQDYGPQMVGVMEGVMWAETCDDPRCDNTSEPLSITGDIDFCDDCITLIEEYAERFIDATKPGRKNL